jgi:phosphoglycerate dehydrogenase-like enzyme
VVRITTSLVNGYPLDAGQRRRIEAAAGRLEVVHHAIEDQAGLDCLDGSVVEVLLSDFAPTDMSAWPRLRWLQYSGAGVDALAETAPWSRGLTVTTASGGNAVAIGEYVLGWLLHVSQQMGQLLDNHRKRAWAETRLELAGHGLRGRTLAIVGYGSVGREVARLARGFGLRIVAVKARPDVRHDLGFQWPNTGDPDGSIPELMVGVEQLDEVVGQADYVLVAAPLTPATRGALGRSVLAALRADAWLINVGRGDIFEEQALLEALREQRFGGAVLDVTWREPLEPTSPLWTMPNVIVTPHVAGLSPTTWDALAELFAQNLRRYLAGEPLLNLVDNERGY